MKNFALFGIFIFVAAAIITFVQPGFAYLPNTFFFEHKIIFGIAFLLIAIGITIKYIKIPRQ